MKDSHHRLFPNVLEKVTGALLSPGVVTATYGNTESLVNSQCHYFKCPVAQITKFVCGPKQTTNLATHSENPASKTSKSAEGILSSRAIDPR